MSDIINKLFNLSEFSEDIGLHIRVRVYAGINYIWFINPLLKDGFHKIQYNVGKKKTTYSQGIRRWVWKEVMFDRSSQVKLPSGEVYKNNGRKWSQANNIHTSHFNISSNEIVDDKLFNWVKKGGIGKEEQYYLRFVATQKETSQLKDIQLNSVNQSLKERVDELEFGKDKLEKRVDKLERLVNQLCKMIKGKEEQIQKLKSLVVPTGEVLTEELEELEKPEMEILEKPEMEILEKPEELEDKLEEPKEDKLEKKTVTFSEEPKELPGPIIGKAKYLNEDLDWEEYDIVELLNEDEALLYLNGEKVGYVENYEDNKIPEDYRDKDDYVIDFDEDGEKLERLFIENKKKYYYVKEYNSVVGCLQQTNLCEIEYF
jgi:hypothetical protein